ncbi:uncharacterized protein EI90DRAFT_3060725 [Cantharellus anzutake]|uniref:uncharacterized protein n=1 Tax=Cantharellus anzutake TaxID=1750568 RepID=UPI0019059543|nr:uncharacterized protein EI90DRAFT_3060725 [Cantharellus anzutake]KAF8330431.1 hypothetical protein EI90DRAFT_3060725 [Cantharellus anzutake]
MEASYPTAHSLLGVSRRLRSAAARVLGTSSPLSRCGTGESPTEICKVSTQQVTKDVVSQQVRVEATLDATGETETSNRAFRAGLAGVPTNQASNMTHQPWISIYGYTGIDPTFMILCYVAGSIGTGSDENSCVAQYHLNFYFQLECIGEERDERLAGLIRPKTR